MTDEPFGRGRPEPTGAIPRRSSLVLFAACAIVALGEVEARADWKTAYAEGYRLARQGSNWEQVAARMQEALKEKDDEGSWVNITSGGAQPYLPYFYLGLARFNLGDCRAAVQHWLKSSSFEQFPQHKQQNEQFRDLFPVCDKDVGAQNALADARSRHQKIVQLSRDPDLTSVWNKEPVLGPALARAEADLQGASRSYDEAKAQDVKRRLGLFLSVQQKAAQLNDQLDAILNTARTRRDTLVATRQRSEEEARKKLAAAAPSSGSTSAPTPTATSEPRLPANTTPTTPPHIAAGDRSAVARPLDEAPSELVTGTNQYFSGQYREALTTLARLPLTPRWQGHSALVRAAAAFALYSAGGQQDKTLLQQATDAARECRTARPGLEPDERWFSPRFVRFFRQQASAERRQAARVPPA